MSMPMFASIPRRQAGFSLIELMVGLAIGLIVSLAVMMGYLGAAQSQRGQSDISRMQEGARFVFDLFGRETRHAAFRNNTYPSASGSQAFGTAVGSNTYLAGTNDASTPTLPDASTPTVINSADVITFRYFGMSTMDTTTKLPSTVAGSSDGTILNCAGTGIRYGEINEDTLYIARDTGNTSNDAAGEPTLFCASRQQVAGTWTAATGSPIALIPGVESMQILYGEDTDSDGIVNHYVKADALTNADFTRVVAVMVSVVMRSPSTSGFSAAQVLNHFGTDYAAANTAPSGDTGSVFTSPTDGRLRRIYSSVFAVRNAL